MLLHVIHLSTQRLMWTSKFDSLVKFTCKYTVPNIQVYATQLCLLVNITVLHDITALILYEVKIHGPGLLLTG